MNTHTVNIDHTTGQVSKSELVALLSDLEEYLGDIVDRDDELTLLACVILRREVEGWAA